MEMHMEIEEIIATCSHPKVASAAVLSIGGAFRSRMALLAAASGVDVGEFVAARVGEFGETVDTCDRHGLRKAVARHPMPVLGGLQLIVEAVLDEEGGRSWRNADGCKDRKRARQSEMS
jgi:hypothetical protein